MTKIKKDKRTNNDLQNITHNTKAVIIALRLFIYDSINRCSAIKHHLREMMELTGD